MSEKSKNDVALSTQMQKNLTHKYASTIEFPKANLVARPATVGSQLSNNKSTAKPFQSTAKSMGKRLKSKTNKRQNDEFPDIDNLLTLNKKGSEWVNPRRKIQLAKERGRNLANSSLNLNCSSGTNLAKTTPNLDTHDYVSSGKLLLVKYRNSKKNKCWKSINDKVFF